MTAYTDDRRADFLDRGAETQFLKLTLARAVTPRMQRRAEALLRLEDLTLRQFGRRGPMGPANGMLLASMVRVFPISHRAMRRELKGRRPEPGIVERAEAIELLTRWVNGLK